MNLDLHRLRTGVLLCLLLCLRASAQDAPLGISEIAGATSVRVWAPNASSVEIIGEFNGWRATGNDKLKKEDNGGIWSTTLKQTRLRGAYQFLINGKLRKRDPCNRAVTPDGKNSLFYDAKAFNWQDDHAPAQSLENLVLYELHVGTFNDPKPDDGRPATFADVIKRLDYLADLGITTLLVMPIHEFSGQHSWGYNPSDPYAVEQAYGGPDGFKALVAEAHKRGLAVHLDIVHNHYGPENLDLIRFDGTGGEKSGGPYFYDQPGQDFTPWGPRVRFDDPQVRRYVRDNAMMWLGEYHVDGFRWDSTINIRSYNDGADSLPAGEQMLDEINAAIRGNFPGRLSIAEDSLEIGNFDGSWDYDFHHAVMAVLRARDDADRRIGALEEALSRKMYMPRIIYVDNHDEAGKINGQTRIANDVAPAEPGGDKARRLCGLGALFTFTAPGSPLLFMGNEFQETGAFHDNRPLDWAKRTKNSGLLALHRDLIRLRRNLDGYGNALKGAGIESPVVNESRKLLAYWRWHAAEPNARMVMAVNLGAQPAQADIPFPSAGPWVVRVNTDSAKYGGSSKEESAPIQFESLPYKRTVALAPYSARIFSLANPAESSQQVTVAAPVEPEGQTLLKFSLYGAIHLVGTFNDWNPTNAALKRASGQLWQGRFSMPEQDDASLKLTANKGGEIFWGAGESVWITPPYRGSLERLGPDLRISRLAAGEYDVTFNEDTLEFSLTPAHDQKTTQEAVFRIWTDSKGRTIEAKLISRQQEMVNLESRTGQKLQLPVGKLSPADRSYLEPR